MLVQPGGPSLLIFEQFDRQVQIGFLIGGCQGCSPNLTLCIDSALRPPDGMASGGRMGGTCGACQLNYRAACLRVAAGRPPEHSGGTVAGVGQPKMMWGGNDSQAVKKQYQLVSGIERSFLSIANLVSQLD